MALKKKKKIEMMVSIGIEPENVSIVNQTDFTLEVSSVPKKPKRKVIPVFKIGPNSAKIFDYKTFYAYQFYFRILDGERE